MEKLLDVKVLRVIDGDTIEVSVEKMKIRLDFVDAPETKGAEKQDGLVTKQWLKDQIEGKTVQLDIKSKDMYERYLSTIFLDGENINGQLITKGLAEIYSPIHHNNGVKD